MKNNMKKIITAVLFLLVIAALPVTSRAEDQKGAEPVVKQSAPASAPEPQAQEEDKVTGEIDLSVLSAYIWRGYEQTRASIVIQPSAMVSYKGFSVNV